MPHSSQAVLSQSVLSQSVLAQSGRTHLVVGAGRMGGALLSGWLSAQVITPAQLIILDPHPGDAAQAAIVAGALHWPDANALTETELSSVKTVLLSIKPQMFDRLAPQLAAHIGRDTLILSILAGTSLARLEAVFAGHPVIRAMPNTPAAIGAGITAFTNGAQVDALHTVRAKTLLAAGGPVYEVATEHMIDCVTAISGSGPAYVFHMVEALEAAALHIGLPEDLAPVFARQTIIGAGRLLAESPDGAARLRQAVTSPGGTTEAALEVLMSEKGLPPLMRATAKAALARAKELA